MTAWRPQDVVDAVLEAAPQGADVTAVVDGVRQLNVRWAAGGVTTNGAIDESSATAIVVRRGRDGLRVGAVTRSGIVPETAASLVAVADAVARNATPLPADESIEPPPTIVDAAFADDPEVPGPEDLGPLVLSLAPALGRWRDARRVAAGYAEQTMHSTWLGSTGGLRRAHHQPSARVEASVRGSLAHGGMASVWAGRAGSELSSVDIAGAAQELDEAWRWNDAGEDLAPGRYRVILTSAAVTDLLVPVLWAAGARDAVEGRSVFAGPQGPRLAEEVTGSRLTLLSDPHDPRAPGRAFTVERASGPTASVLDTGADESRVPWIDRGRLQHLVGPRSYRRVLDAARPTGDNVIVDAQGNGDLASLIARTDDAVLITCLWYIREVDPQRLLLTGLTRDGVYRVRDGEVVAALPNLRFNVAPLDLFTRIVDASDAARTQPREWADYVDRAVAPAVVVDGFNLSTPSDAR